MQREGHEVKLDVRDYLYKFLIPTSGTEWSDFLPLRNFICRANLEAGKFSSLYEITS
jgi:hypothetical protein